MNNNELDSKKNGKLKIIIPIIVVVLVIAVWFIKNSSENIKNNANQMESAPSATESQIEQDSSEFALHVTSNLDMEQLKSYGLPLIIDFGADSCIPCKEMAPVLKELNEELRGKAIIKFVDVWKYQELAIDFPLKIIPTQFFFDKDGNPYWPTNAVSSKLIMYNRNDDTNEHVYTAHEGGMTKEQMLSILKEMGVE